MLDSSAKNGTKLNSRAFWIFPLFIFVLVLGGVILGMTFSLLSSSKTATGTITFAVDDKEGQIDVKNGFVSLNFPTETFITVLKLSPRANYRLPTIHDVKCYVGDHKTFEMSTIWTEISIDPSLESLSAVTFETYENFVQLNLKNINITGAIKIAVNCPAESRNVLFDTDFGECEITSKSIEYGSMLGELPTPIKKGYTFWGWFDALGATQYDSTFIVNSNLILYAKYTPNEYNIILNSDGGNCSIESMIVKFDEVLSTLPTPTKEGHNFLGWYTKNIGGERILSTTKYCYDFDTTFYANWQIKRFTMSLDANGGSVSIESQQYSYKQVCVTLAIPVYSGYDFLGWYTDSTAGLQFSNENGVVYPNIVSMTTEYNELLIEEDLMLFAHWAATGVENRVETTNFVFSIDSVTKTASVVNCKKNTGGVEIPSYIYFDSKLWCETEDNSQDGVEYYVIKGVNAYSFARNNALTSIKVPNTVVKIEESAFYGCSSLEAIELPFVGSRPLYVNNYYSYAQTNSNESLENCFGIIFGDKEFVGSYPALQGIQKNTYAIAETNMAVKQIYYIPNFLKTIIINTGVNATTVTYCIFSCAFQHLKNVENIKFNGDKYIRFGPMCFGYCTNLKGVDWEDKKLLTGYSGVFYECENLKKTGDYTSAWIGADFMVNCPFVDTIYLSASNRTSSGSHFSKMSTFENVFYCGQNEFKYNDSYPQQLTVRLCGLPLKIGGILYPTTSVYNNATKNLYVQTGATFGLDNEDFSKVFFEYYYDNGKITIDGVEYSHYVRGAVLNCHYRGLNGEYIDVEGNVVESEIVTTIYMYSGFESSITMPKIPQLEGYEVYWVKDNGEIFEIYFTSKVLYVGEIELYLHFNEINPQNVQEIQVEINKSDVLYSNSIDVDTIRAWDPSVISVVENGKTVYYMYATDNGVGIYRSEDLVSWAKVGEMLNPQDYYVELSDGIEFDLNWFKFNFWAGECICIEDKYYFFFTAVDKYATLRTDSANQYYYDPNTSEKNLSKKTIDGISYVLSYSMGVAISDTPTSGFVPYNNTPYKIVAKIRNSADTIELCISEETKNYLESMGVEVLCNENYDSTKPNRGIDQPYINNDELYKQAYVNHYSNDSTLTTGQKLIIIENGDEILLSNCLPSMGDVKPFIDPVSKDLYLYFYIKSVASSKVYYDGDKKTETGYGTDANGNYYTTLDNLSFLAGLKVDISSFTPVLPTFTRLTVTGSQNLDILNDWNAGVRTTAYFEDETTENVRSDIYYRNGKYYLIYNSNGYNSVNQRIRQAISVSPLGSYNKISYIDGGVIIMGGTQFHYSAFGTGGFIDVNNKTYMVYHALETENRVDSQRFICVSEIGFIDTTINDEILAIMCCVSSGFGSEIIPIYEFTNKLWNANISGNSFMQDATCLVDGLVYNNDNCTALTTQYHASKYDVVTISLSAANSFNALMIYAGDEVELSNFESIRQILLTDKNGNIYRIPSSSFNRPASGGDGMFIEFDKIENITKIEIFFSSDMCISEIKGYDLTE